MTRTTRRAFVGGGLAVAAGAGLKFGGLPLLGETHKHLAFSAHNLEARADLPAFGSLRPDDTAEVVRFGELRTRPHGAAAGSLTIAPVAHGGLHVHTLDLPDGMLVAIGDGTEGRQPIAYGTRAYAAARGHITIRSSAIAVLDLDVELEL